MSGWFAWTLVALVAWSVVAVVVGLALAFAFGRLEEAAHPELDEDAMILPLTRAVSDEREQAVVSLASARARRQDAGRASAHRTE